MINYALLILMGGLNLSEQKLGSNGLGCVCSGKVRGIKGEEGEELQLGYKINGRI